MGTEHVLGKIWPYLLIGVAVLIAAFFASRKAKRKEGRLDLFIKTVALEMDARLERGPDTSTSWNPPGRGWEKVTAKSPDEVHFEIEEQEAWVEFGKGLDDSDPPKATHFSDLVWLAQLEGESGLMAFCARGAGDGDRFDVVATNPATAYRYLELASEQLTGLHGLSSDGSFSVAQQAMSARVRISGWPEDADELSAFIQASREVVTRFKQAVEETASDEALSERVASRNGSVPLVVTMTSRAPAMCSMCARPTQDQIVHELVGADLKGTAAFNALGIIGGLATGWFVLKTGGTKVNELRLGVCKDCLANNTPRVIFVDPGKGAVTFAVHEDYKVAAVELND